MNLSQFYKLVLLIVLLGNIYAAQILPIKDENNIRLNIGDRERIYHEIPEEGLLFKGIGNSFDVGDSLRIGDRVKIGIYSRTVKSPTGNKKGILAFLSNGMMKFR